MARDFEIILLSLPRFFTYRFHNCGVNYVCNKKNENKNGKRDLIQNKSSVDRRDHFFSLI